MKREAFTLAEVLITLGIVGIVVAMTLPVLIQKKHNKELETQFKKAYSSIQQAVVRANYEYEDLNSLYSGNYISSQEEGKHLHEILGKQFATAQIIDGRPNNKDIKTYNNFASNPCTFDDGYILAAGLMDIYFETVCDIFITVDINGGKGPSKLGYDVFMFVLGKGDKLIPVGSPESAKYRMCVSGSPSDLSDMDITCSKTSTSNFNGVGCAYPALTDSNYFKNLP